MQDNNIFENTVGENENNENFSHEQINETSAEQVIYNTYNNNFNYMPKGFNFELLDERKKIKKSANIVGAMLLTFFGFILIFNLLIVALGFAFKGYDKFREIISDPAVNHFTQILLSISLFTIPFIFISKAADNRISDLISLKKPEKGLFLPLFFFGAAACSFANIAVSYSGEFFSKFGINYNVDYGQNPKGIFGFLLSLIATAIVPALAEEFAFRGIIMGILRRFGDGFAVLTSAIIFGVLHGNFEQMPFAFLVGLALGFIAIKSGSLWTAIAVHFFNNLISVLMDYFVRNISVSAQNVIYSLFLIITLLIGIASLIKFKNKEDFYKLENVEMQCGEFKKYKWFFLSPTIIIFTIIFVLEAFAFFIV